MASLWGDAQSKKHRMHGTAVARSKRLGQEGLESQEEKYSCTSEALFAEAMIREKQGVLGDVSRLMRGSLVAPSIDAVHIQRYFGDLKGFGAAGELVTILTGGVPVNAAASGADLERALQCGNHSSVMLIQ